MTNDSGRMLTLVAALLLTSTQVHATGPARTVEEGCAVLGGIALSVMQLRQNNTLVSVVNEWADGSPDAARMRDIVARAYAEPASGQAAVAEFVNTITQECLEEF